MGSKSVKTRRENGKRVVEYYDEQGNKTSTHVDGEVSWRNNNPGNLKWDGKRNPEFFKDKLGAIGSDGTFAVFPSWEDGIKAKTNLMKVDGKYKGKSISEAMHLYAPPAENNTKAYLEFIKQKSGLDLSKKVDELSADDYEKFMGAIRDYESSGPQRGKGTVINHSGQAAKPDLSTLCPEPRPKDSVPGGAPEPKRDGADASGLLQGGEGNDTLVGSGGNDTLVGGGGNDEVSEPAQPPTGPLEQNGSSAPADPRAASLVQMASAPVTDPGRSAVLKPVEKLTEAEMKDMIGSAQTGFRGWRSGDPLKAHLYEKVQDWHVNVYGDAPQKYDGGKPVEPTPVRAIAQEPSPHATPQGEDLWQATGRLGQKVADAGATDGFDDAVKALQRGLNMLNQAQPLPPRSPAYGAYTKLGPVTEDGKYGPQTDFALKHATARLGAPKVEEAFALGRFNTFARNAQRNGSADGLEARTHAIFGPLFRSPDAKAPKIEGGVLQETLNTIGPRHHDDWEPLKVDNWIGPKTTDAFGRVLKAEDADEVTTAFGRGLGLV